MREGEYVQLSELLKRTAPKDVGEFGVNSVCLPKARWLGGTACKWFNILDLPHAVQGASVSEFKGRSAVGRLPRLQSPHPGLGCQSCSLEEHPLGSMLCYAVARQEDPSMSTCRKHANVCELGEVST